MEVEHESSSYVGPFRNAGLHCLRGVVGLIIGIVDGAWNLSVTGWFTGGTLLAVLAIVILADEYFATRGEAGG